jgi:metallo-beta-lactamase class B
VEKNMKLALGALAATAAALCAPSHAQTPPASQENISAYVTEAERLAGDDLKALLALCKPAPAVRPAADITNKYIAAMIGRPAPEPGRAFDNLCFVGGAWASAWLLRGTQGAIPVIPAQAGIQVSP